MNGKHWISILALLMVAVVFGLAGGVFSSPEGDGQAETGQAAPKGPNPTATIVTGSSEASEAANADAGATKIAEAAEKKPADAPPKLPPGMGAIVGTIRLAGKVPTVKPLVVPASNRDHKACVSHVQSERLVLGPKKEVRDVFVSVAGHKPKKRPAPMHVVLDNSKCSFTPHAIAATRGSTLEITNSDPFLHNSHGMLTENFNTAVIKGAPHKRKLRKPGWSVIKCDIHPWMQAQLHVFDHELFAVSDGKGNYRIVAPPGEYELEVWHEMLAFAFGTNPKKRVGKVTVKAGETVRLDVELEAPKSAFQ